MLRVAAQTLGSPELAKSCEDLQQRHPERGVPRGASRPEALDSELPPAFPSSDRLPERGGGSCGSASSASAATGTEDIPSAWDLKSSAPSSDLHTQSGATTGDDSRPVRVTSRNAFESSGQEARVGPMVKPRGERSFTDRPALTPQATAGEKAAAADGDGVKRGPETGGVRRVLSEIKRNIVESSRIIADKTFQQMYELVPGDRGILGEGINGPVRMALHRKTGREVAVKRISCHNLSEQRRQMLVSEVRIFLQVSHRNIVQLLEVYESEVDQAVLLVMELCTGKELFERLAERRWYSEFDAARVARQMLDAVSYLHTQNICHRDLKLENWLYEDNTSEAKLKLCDFGFGQIVEPSVQLTATLGSLFYVAPEVLEGSYGLPCDMWSVGARWRIVYMLLSGVPPFDGKTDADVMQKIRNGRFQSSSRRWEGISETAKHFVRSMLRKDPYERLTAAEAAQHAWLKMETQPKLLSWPKGGPDSELELPIDRGVVRDMWKFAQNNAITKAAAGMLAQWCTTSFGGREGDLVLLEQRFRSHDESNSGSIGAEFFIQAIKETLNSDSIEEKSFFDRIAGNPPGNDPGQGADGRGRRRPVNYNEFINLTKARRMANNTAAIREAFRAIDTVGDGFIKEDDMHTLLGDEFRATINNYVDTSGKEFIDYRHFANIVSKEMAEKDGTKQLDSVGHRSSTDAAACASEDESSARAGPPPAADSLGDDGAQPPGAAGAAGAAAASTSMQLLRMQSEASSLPDADDLLPNHHDGTDAAGAARAEREAGAGPGAPGREPGAAAPEGGAQAAQAEEDAAAEDEEDACDAGAESEEEMLVNVDNPTAGEAGGGDAVPLEEKKQILEDRPRLFGAGRRQLWHQPGPLDAVGRVQHKAAARVPQAGAAAVLRGAAREQRRHGPHPRLFAVRKAERRRQARDNHPHGLRLVLHHAKPEVPQPGGQPEGAPVEGDRQVSVCSMVDPPALRPAAPRVVLGATSQRPAPVEPLLCYIF
ncbi:unnamed protein product [Prorocentrum cordatum]|uniref:Non-specific serine/threonine protein kinase n=1 Tax=Prorocentrum cordatum TaxID=2364126 RepID=A0ABN9XU11_9DINO|nr:unnamed protein product [Polarella glacialis]